MIFVWFLDEDHVLLPNRNWATAWVSETPLNEALSNYNNKTNWNNYSSELNNLQPSNKNLKRTKDIKDIKDLSKQEKGIWGSEINSKSL